jgi:hypothetical protein
MRNFTQNLHIVLLLTTALFLYIFMTFYTGWRMPLSAGPDEVAHFKFARFLEQRAYLPLTPEDRELAGYKSDQPPLNAILVALASWTSGVDEPPYVKIAHGIPRRHLARDGWVDQYGVIRYWDVVNTEDPAVGEILLWRAGRILSAIFSGLSLIVIYFMAEQVFVREPQRRLWALGAVFSVAFIPTFIFISSVFSYEALLGLWLSFYLLIAIHIFNGNNSWWFYLLAGLSAGLAMVTKLSALPMLVSLLTLILLAGLKQHQTVRQNLSRLAIGISGLLLGAGWWFVWIIYNLNEVNELGWIAGLVAPVISADGSDEASALVISELSAGGFENVDLVSLSQFQGWRTVIFNTFWTPDPQGQNTVLAILFIFSILTLVGLVRVYWVSKEQRLLFIFLGLHLALFFLLPLMRLVLIDSKTEAGQGHHILFPAAGAWAIFITLGAGAWFPKAKGWLAGMLLGTGLMIWTIFHIGQIYPTVNPAPVKTIPPILPPSAQEFDVSFDNFELKGFELIGLDENDLCCKPSAESLKINLYWLADGLNTEDYRVQITLIDPTGEPRTSWVGYTADGRYPTRAWEPGDIIRDEIFLPLTGLGAAVHKLQLQLWGNEAAWSAVDGNTAFELAQVQLQSPQPASDMYPFRVWQAGNPVDDFPVFHNRSTIQITTRPEVYLLGLKSEAGTVYEPVNVTEQTYNFIVDPLWARGNYRLLITNGKSDQTTDPILRIAGEARQTEIPESQVEIRANFANQIMLLGYTLRRRHLAAGEELPLTLNWQALNNMPTDFMMFTRIRDETGQVWGGRDRWPREFYSPLLWVKGETVQDGFSIPVSPDAPDGLYYLDVGFYFVVGEAPVSLPLIEDDQMSDKTTVSIGPFKVGGLDVNTELPDPDQLVNQSLGDAENLVLIGYDVVDDDMENSSDPTATNLKLVLYWRSEAPLDLDYTTFVHVRNSAGDIITQKDQLPLEGAYPTSLWQPGEVIADELSVPLPVPFSPAGYEVAVGMYNTDSGTRLQIPGTKENSLVLGHLTLDNNSLDTPSFDGIKLTPRR